MIGNGLKYDRGADERFDLKPPSSISVEMIGNQQNFPLDLRVNEAELKNLLNDEGVLNGDPVQFIFLFPESAEILGNTSLLQKIEELLSMGEHQWHPEVGHLVKINMQGVLNLASWLGLSKEKFIPVAEKLLATFLAHEIGHCRQPENISHVSEDLNKGFKSTAFVKFVGGAFLIIDGLRRMMVPWLGPLEPFAVGGETMAASQLIYRNSPQEKFAREYKDFGWKDFLGLRYQGSVLDRFKKVFSLSIREGFH